MDSGHKRKCLITNKNATEASIRRRLKRYGFTHTEIINYLRGWNSVNKNKE